MRITRNTRNITKYLTHIKFSESYFLGLPADVYIEGQLRAMGFETPLVAGHSLLPPSHLGPASRRNAEGREIVHRDQPMETAYRQAIWTWKEFRGRYDSEEKSKMVDVPYQRYPRTVIPPYGIELRIEIHQDGRQFVVAGPFLHDTATVEVATNTANMLVEAIGSFEVLGANRATWNKTPVRKLNWQVLPPGKNPWEASIPVLEDIIRRAPEGNQEILRARLAAVGKKEPDFVAIGVGGFDGYTVFGFEAKALCVLECPRVNNATYVLPMDSWESISQMSKAEILDSKAHKARLVHNQGWFRHLDTVMAERRT